MSVNLSVLKGNLPLPGEVADIKKDRTRSFSLDFFIANPGRYDITVDFQDGTIEITEIPRRSEDPEIGPIAEAYNKVQEAAQRCVTHALNRPLRQAFISHINQSAYLNEQYAAAVKAYREAGGKRPCPEHGSQWGT